MPMIQLIHLFESVCARIVNIGVDPINPTVNAAADMTNKIESLIFLEIFMLVSSNMCFKNMIIYYQIR